MSAADEFRQHAAVCLRAAQLALVPDIRATLIDMAQNWNQLADHMDRLAVYEGPAQSERAAIETPPAEGRDISFSSAG